MYSSSASGRWHITSFTIPHSFIHSFIKHYIRPQISRSFKLVTDCWNWIKISQERMPIGGFQGVCHSVPSFLILPHSGCWTPIMSHASTRAVRLSPRCSASRRTTGRTYCPRVSRNFEANWQKFAKFQTSPLYVNNNLKFFVVLSKSQSSLLFCSAILLTPLNWLNCFSCI